MTAQPLTPPHQPPRGSAQAEPAPFPRRRRHHRHSPPPPAKSPLACRPSPSSTTTTTAITTSTTTTTKSRPVAAASAWGAWGAAHAFLVAAATIGALLVVVGCITPPVAATADDTSQFFKAAVKVIRNAKLTGAAAKLAPLEQPEPSVMLGAWYDRPNRDTPAAINKRLNFKPLAFFQTDIDLSGEKKKETSPNITTQFLQDLQDSNSDAMAFLTVYPFQGFAAVTDAQLTDLLNRVAAIIATGRSVFLRYAPEMNGSWFEYGQKPTDFKASWIKVREFIRLGLGSNADRVAFVWSPNSGFNYPWPKENQTLSPSNTPDWDVLDTDHNNVIDGQDDAYGPYYPGDDHVDWVGLSIYHYGLYYQWTQNVVPLDGYFEAYLTGVSPSVNLTSTQPFYDWFSGAGGSAASAGNKPFIVSETGAAFHYDWNPAEQHDPTLTLDVTSVSRVEIKQSWWRQFLNPAFLSKYPRIKAICTFEFDKAEEWTMRDFTSMGATPVSKSPDLVNAVGVAFAQDLAGDWGKAIRWGSQGNPTPVTVSVVSTSTTVASVSTFTPTANTRSGGSPANGRGWIGPGGWPSLLGVATAFVASLLTLVLL